jgi:hypothetical protein
MRKFRSSQDSSSISREATGAVPVQFESIIPNPKAKLPDQLREVMRLKHYSIRTERSYIDWVRRYVKFHRMKSRDDMFPPESKIKAFLSDLAVNGRVAVSTQNQAFNALLFVYEQVLHHRLGKVDSVRATRPVRVPTVLTPEEVRSIIGNLSGTPQLVVKLIGMYPATLFGIASPPIYSVDQTSAPSRTCSATTTSPPP